MGNSFIEQIEEIKLKGYIKSIPFHICAFVFFMIGMSPIFAILIDFIFCIGVSFISKSRSDRRFYDILDQQCDPEKFLIKLDEYEEVVEDNDKILNKINLARAMAYISLGEYDAAQDCLKAINVNVIEKNNRLYIRYILIKMTCHYGLEEIGRAEKLYEKYKSTIRLSSDKFRDDIEILIGERLFYRKEYEKCYRHLIKLLNRKINLRYSLFALYRLAMIDFQVGNDKQSYEKLKEIAEKGNTLWIQKEAQRYMNESIM